MIRPLLESDRRKTLLPNSWTKLSKPTKWRRHAEAVPVEEGVPRRLADRQDDEDGEEDDGRGKEDRRGEAAARVAGLSGFGKMSRSMPCPGRF